MTATNIAWTDEVWNPVTGCSKVSPGCAHCYAEALSNRFGRSTLPWTPGNAAANVVLHPERLDQPLRWRKPRRVFVNSMSDLFHERVPLTGTDGRSPFIDVAFAVMAQARRHTFQVLTKRPERMRQYLSGDRDYRIGLAMIRSFGGGCGVLWTADHKPIPMTWPLPNVWLGTSIENDRWTGRADALCETPAAVRFISAEPLLGPLPSLNLTGIDWLIVGGESGPGHRDMDPAWVESLVAQADAAGVPVFVKQDSGSRPGQQGRLGDALWARKDFPR